MKKIIFVVFLFFFMSYSCNAQLQSLMNIKTWAYQLQGMNISQIAADTSFGLVIIDYSSDGTDAEKFSPTQIAQIKVSGKKVISYISIGEAEDYRYYWQSSWSTTPPSWLGPENPNWAGNYKVKFWDPAWQNIVFSYVDTIINQGFDGIYMDIIDGYYYWMVENPQQQYADTLMMQFVKNIRNHVDSVTGNTDFIMIPQNAEDIINSINVSVPQKSAYFNAVNATGIEDVFCYGDLDEDNPYSPDAYRIGQLQEWQSNNKQVFSIEYLTQTTLINQYINGAHSNNFVPYVCTRALDQLCSGIPVSIEKTPDDKNLLLFPNPSSGIVFISSDMLDNNSEIFLFSSLGQILKNYRLNELKKSGNWQIIDLSMFPDEIYYIEIASEKGNSFKKVIRSH